MEKTKITNNVEATSLSHSTKQDENDRNISNRVKKMGDSISINNGGHEDKKMLLFYETV